MDELNRERPDFDVNSVRLSNVIGYFKGEIVVFYPLKGWVDEGFIQIQDQRVFYFIGIAWTDGSDAGEEEVSKSREVSHNQFNFEVGLN